MDIKPIRTERDYRCALRRVEQLWNSRENSPEADELEVLATLVEAYEQAHYPMDLPSPVEAIRFRLEQQGKDMRSLVGVIGQRTRVYEVMRGDRSLSLNMIRSLHEKLGIPAELLIRLAPRRMASKRRSAKLVRLARRRMRKSA